MKLTDFRDQHTFIRRVTGLGKDSTPKKTSEFLANLCWEFPPSILYLEEVVGTVGKHDAIAKSHPFVYKILQQGRAGNRGMIAATQMIKDLNDSFLRQCTDVLVFGMKPEECRRVEEKLNLVKGSLAFDLPSNLQVQEDGTVKWFTLKPSEWKDLYRFYYIDFQNPVMFERIPYKKKAGRKPKKPPVIPKEEREEKIAEIVEKTEEEDEDKKKVKIVEVE